MGSSLLSKAAAFTSSAGKSKPIMAALLVTGVFCSPAMANTITGGTILGIFSGPVKSGYLLNDPSVGKTTYADNSSTADYSISNSIDPTTAGTPPLQATGSALIWGDNNGGNGQPSTLDFFGAPIPSNVNQNFRLGRITFGNGTSDLDTLIFGATISFYANSVSSATLLGSDTIYISTTKNFNQSTSQDADYVNICGNQSNICSKSIDAVEISEGGTGVTVDLYGTIVGDPQLVINAVKLAPGQTSSTNGFIGGQLPTVPLPATLPMFGTALLMLGMVGFGMKRRKAAA